MKTEALPGPLPDKSPDARALRLLLVEDRDDDAELILLTLKMAGWEVRYCRVDSAEKMTRALAEQPWDIIISDYAMPGFSGLAALRIAREKASETPFILVSGTVSEEVAVEAMKGGACDYLFKGNLRRLPPAVERELREAHGRRTARQVEARLQERERQLAEAQQAARLGSWIYEVHEDTVILSPEAARICRRPLGGQALPFSDFVSCLHPDDRAPFVDSLYLADAHDFSRDCRVQHPDATVRHVHLRGEILREPSGRTSRVTGTIQDITERKQIEEELILARATAEAASRAKDEFLSVLSHELRTPLTPVLITLALLEKSRELSPEVREDLKMIQEQVELEARLIDDLLDVTRITQNKLTLQIGTVDAHVLLRSVVDSCCRSRSADVSLRLNAGLHHVRADFARLQQAVWNVVANALKFTPPGNPIQITTANPDADAIEIQVEDSGIGIDPSLLPRVFSVFEQGDSSLKRNFGGLGLGLTITKAIIEGHGGRISASSAGTGRGAIIRMHLPTVSAPAARPLKTIQPVVSVSPSSQLSILLVDDQPATLGPTLKLLNGLGHRVRPASTVAEAVGLLAVEAVNLIITNSTLQDGSGLDILRAAREKHPVDGILIRTASEPPAEDPNLLAELVRPLDVSELRGLVDRLSARSAAAPSAQA